jgi:bifunctional non-homologous end joining protein LigD
MSIAEIKLSVSLYYKDGSSDKVYHVQLRRVVPGYAVDFQYGRRGQSLQSGTKTQTPVEYDKAKKIFDKLVNEKKAKGYTEGEEGTPYQGNENAGTLSGVTPQLLNFIEEDDLEKYFKDPEWVAQEKMDGVRCLIVQKNGIAQGSNRKGLVVNLPETIVKDIQQLDGDNIFDGERIGDSYYVFDVLQRGSVSLAKTTYLERYDDLVEMFEPCTLSAIKIVPLASTEGQKRALYKELREREAEGIVFKKGESFYVPGRPASGGNQVKFKFYSTGTFRVIKVNDKRSVALAVYAGPGAVPSPIGNVTIPANHQIPKVGDLVEVRYLYAFMGGSLFQPTYLGKRDDKEEADWAGDLKFKANSDEEAA